LFKDTVGRPWRKLVARPARDGNQPALTWVLELAMAATRAIEIPTVGFNQLYCISDFHIRKAAPSRRTPTPKAFASPRFAQSVESVSAVVLWTWFSDFNDATI
jgi:hypothetical protein